MSTINDGGPAFPCSNEQLTHGNPQVGDAWSGMSLRDYFAGQALMGFMANTKRPTTYAADDAAWAYTIADAMLAAREAKP